VRGEFRRSVQVVALAVLGVAISSLVYDDGAIGVLAYSLGFATALLAASNARQSAVRAEQAELLLAQSHRSHEEQLRAARLEESTRIARDIHDVLAHALAGLTIQLEATHALIEQGVDRDTLLARVDRAHELAREGLRETRRAVGALRGETVPVPARLESLLSEFGDDAALSFDGDPARLEGRPGEAVLRVVQEALTNVRKHAPGAAVRITLTDAADFVELTVVNGPARDAPSYLASSGGGYGLTGLKERAELAGGTLDAGPCDAPAPEPSGAGSAGDGIGWQVRLRIPTASAGQPTS
jgi:signal transduction histidine kinase